MEADTRRGVARLINPEAGSHVVSLDPLERSAAVAATARSWQEFPYYPQRYGSRGWKFSLSDSGWLQTLPDLTEREAREQARWLASVLSARGMPSYLLERHLEVLHEEMGARAAGGGSRYARLLVCRDELRTARLRQLTEADMHAVAEAFETGTRELRERVANVGLVLATAVADERNGFPGAVDAVVGWAMDETRFSAPWRVAVRAAIAAARAAPEGTG
jgi:hypothetical protein